MEKLMHYLECVLLSLLNLCIQIIPRRQPSAAKLKDCKIVSHRGEHDNRLVRENTMAAFTTAAQAGCWGLEFDLRWTRDLQPVVFHDLNTKRVFAIDLVVSQLSLEQLQQRIPEIPTLKEVVEVFGGRHHLMIELKHDDLGAYAPRAQCLSEILLSLEPESDYHFLALQTGLYDLVEFAGLRARVPVAQINTRVLSRAALQRGYGGVCAQYLLITKKMIEQHHHHGQKVGSGFASSKYGLFREINRGVDWIFTNDALRLEAIRRDLLRQD